MMISMKGVFYLIKPNASQKFRFCTGTVATAEGGCFGLSLKTSWKETYMPIKIHA